MSKSIYSLVLDDEVVRLIDRMAYAEGQSRSAVINRVLAERVGYSTGEMQMRGVFKKMEEALRDTLLPMLSESNDSTYRIRSALAYKYNPTVKYTVALGGDGVSIGELRAQVRSRSDGFTLMMLQFFRLWEKLEEAYIGRTDVSYGPNRLTRKLVPHLKSDGRILDSADGAGIAAYINAFDGAMKAFFDRVNDPADAARAAEAHMAAYVKNNEVLM